MKNLFRAVRRYLTMLALLTSSRYSRENGWYVERANVRIALENLIDFLTVYDLYARNHYKPLEAAAVPGSVLWDIGANLGTTSLIFAQNPKVSHIYAYEPVPQTIAYAMRSLRLNPDLSPKITLESLGIGSCDGDLNVNFTGKAKCAIGISDMPPAIKMLGRVKQSDLEVITIRLVDAAQVLLAIRSRHPDARILLKLDAEGAEYQIVDRLIETGAINEIAAAAIEWHLSPGEKYITSRLHDAGFQTRATSLENDGSTGMIDAWRGSPGFRL